MGVLDVLEFEDGGQGGVEPAEARGFLEPLNDLGGYFEVGCYLRERDPVFGEG